MRILCVTSVKDEAPYLVEWLAHLRALGVTDLLIFTNDCSDGSIGLLDEISGLSWLTRVDNPYSGQKTVQWQALAAAAEHPLYKAADWVLGVDVDEFLTLSEPFDTLPALLNAAPGDAITLPWRLFGSGGHVERPAGPVTQTYRKAAPRDILLPGAHFFKTLYRPNAFGPPGVHRPKSGGSQAKWLDSALQPLPGPIAADDNRINLWGHFPKAPVVQLNHYAVRSVEEFMAKRARGLPNKMSADIGLSYWVSRNFNQTTCTRIDLHHAKASAIAEELRSARIKALEALALEYHSAQLKKRLRTKAETELYWSLVLAGGSFAPPVGVTNAHLARLKEAYRNG
ncbi:MAG: glycosyltransferase family 2 protein [Pseudomonadota bacterium]